MKAIRVHAFGDVDVLVYEDVEPPVPADGQVLVRVKAAGVGPWDAWVRSGTSKIQQQLPLTPGADLAGVVERAGTDTPFRRGDEVYGVTNGEFVGAYAEYAARDSDHARAETGNTSDSSKPHRFPSSPAPRGRCSSSTDGSIRRNACWCTAARATSAPTRCRWPGMSPAKSSRRRCRTILDYVRSLGAHHVIDVRSTPFESEAKDVDVVVDTVGGETLSRSFAVLKPGGVLVSSVSLPDQETGCPSRRARRVLPRQRHIRGADTNRQHD